MSDRIVIKQNVTTKVVIKVPGFVGPAGPTGQGAYTVLTAPLTLPFAPGSVPLAVTSTAWNAVGQTILISGTGGKAVITITSITSPTQMVGDWLQYTGDAAPGSVISTGAKVVAEGVRGNTGASGVGSATQFIYQPGGTAAGNVYTDFTLLCAAVLAAPGLKDIVIDCTGASGGRAHIPAGSYNFGSNVTLVGIPSQRQNSKGLTVDAGVTWATMPHVRDLDIISNAGTVVNLTSTTAERYIFSGKNGFQNNGAAPFFVQNGTVQTVFTFDGNTIVQTGSNRLFRAYNATVELYGACVLSPNTFFGTSVTFAYIFSAASKVIEPQTGGAAIAYSYQENASRVQYQPADASQWMDPPPDFVSDALDALRFHALNVSTVFIYSPGYGADAEGIYTDFDLLLDAVAAAPGLKEILFDFTGSGSQIHISGSHTITNPQDITFVGRIKDRIANKLVIFDDGATLNEFPRVRDLYIRSVSNTPVVAFNDNNIRNYELFGQTRIQTTGSGGFVKNSGLGAFNVSVYDRTNLDPASSSAIFEARNITVNVCDSTESTPGAYTAHAHLTPYFFSTGAKFGDPTAGVNPERTWVTDAFYQGYTPSAPTDWASVPANLQDALDYLAGNESSPTITYRPGGTPGNGIYTDAVKAFTALAAIQGPKTLRFDGSVSPEADLLAHVGVVPDPGPFLTIVGDPTGSQQGNGICFDAPGIFSSLPTLVDCYLVYRGSGGPLIPLTNQDVVLSLKGYSYIENQSASHMITQSLGIFQVYMHGTSAFGTITSGRVIAAEDLQVYCLGNNGVGINAAYGTARTGFYSNAGSTVLTPQTGGAALSVSYIDSAPRMEYIPTTSADFPVQIKTVQQGLDQVAGGSSITPSRVAAALAGVTADLSIANHLISTSAVPTAANHLVNKAYVDAIAIGLLPKGEMTAVATSNVATTSGLAQVVDSVALNTPGMLVLLTAQTNPINNGIYVVGSSGWVRVANLAAGSSATGVFVFVAPGGASFGNSAWWCYTSPAVVGTNALTFTQFNGLADVVNGNGLLKVGNTLSVGLADSSLEFLGGLLSAKSYVDAHTVIIARAARTSNLTSLSGATVVCDTITVATGQIALLTAQTTASQNGPWVVGTWVRPPGFTGGASGRAVLVANGASLAGTVWICTSTPGSDTIGTNNLTFTASPAIGNGLSKTLGVISLNLFGDGSLVFSGGQLKVGVITDAEHGTRAGGTTHPLTDGTTEGFYPNADYFKLAGISVPIAVIFRDEIEDLRSNLTTSRLDSEHYSSRYQGITGLGTAWSEDSGTTYGGLRADWASSFGGNKGSVYGEYGFRTGLYGGAGFFGASFGHNSDAEGQGSLVHGAGGGASGLGARAGGRWVEGAGAYADVLGFNVAAPEDHSQVRGLHGETWLPGMQSIGIDYILNRGDYQINPVTPIRAHTPGETTNETVDILALDLRKIVLPANAGVWIRIEGVIVGQTNSALRASVKFIREYLVNTAPDSNNIDNVTLTNSDLQDPQATGWTVADSGDTSFFRAVLKTNSDKAKLNLAGNATIFHAAFYGT